MSLDGPMRYMQPRCDLGVGQTGDEMSNDLKFTRTERFGGTHVKLPDSKGGVALADPYSRSLPFALGEAKASRGHQSANAVPSRANFRRSRPNVGVGPPVMCSGDRIVGRSQSSAGPCHPLAVTRRPSGRRPLYRNLTGAVHDVHASATAHGFDPIAAENVAWLKHVKIARRTATEWLPQQHDCLSAQTRVLSTGVPWQVEVSALDVKAKFENSLRQ
jgi:hypothetical protein